MGLKVFLELLQDQLLKEKFIVFVLFLNVAHVKLFSCSAVFHVFFGISTKPLQHPHKWITRLFHGAGIYCLILCLQARLPRGPIKTTPQLVRVKVSDFVKNRGRGKCRVVCQPAAWQLVCAQKSWNESLLCPARGSGAADMTGLTAQSLTSAWKDRSASGRYYSLSATSNLQDTCPQFMHSWRLQQALI